MYKEGDRVSQSLRLEHCMAAEVDHGSGGTKGSRMPARHSGPIEPASRRVLNAHAVAFDRRLSRHVSHIDPRQIDPSARKGRNEKPPASLPGRRP